MVDSLYRAKERHATWLELFFDLVFVAVIGVIAWLNWVGLSMNMPRGGSP